MVQLNKTDEVIDSYKSEFNSPLGAYVYLLLNQQMPELFVVSSDSKRNMPITAELLKVLTKAESLENIISDLKVIPNKMFEDVISLENDVSAAAVSKLISNLKYMPLSLNTKDDWNNLSGLIEYNNFSPYVKDTANIISQLKLMNESFSMNSVSLNPNYNPQEFINNISSGINTMCETLNLNPKYIGLNTLDLNYQTEEGDFTGYVHGDEIKNKMVIKKTEVFAHEWMHFIDSSFGVQGYNLTELMKILDKDNFKTFLSDLDQLIEFVPTMVKNETDYSTINFPVAIQSVSHFLTKYALDKDTFLEDIGTIAQRYQETCSDNVNAKNELVNSIKDILNPNHPPRYFSFIEAQCELYIDAINEQKLIENQFVTFSKKADKILNEEDYTSSIVEGFARTYESYLSEKVNGKKCAIIADSYSSDMYPQGKMKENMHSQWDKMFDQIRNKIDGLMNPKKKNFDFNNIVKVREKYLKEKSTSPSLNIN